MPISAYVGLPRSGKSYEVVSTVVVNAVKSGRRVVTNIDGINQEKIHEYILKENPSIKPEQLGTILHVSNDDVLSPNFFFFGKYPDSNDEFDETPKTIVLPGDLTCIDEAWRFWSTDQKIHLNHYNFFRYHGHYVHPETKQTCDLVLMVQAVEDLNRKLKAVVNFTYVTRKLKALGLYNRYTITVYEGHKIRNQSQITRQVKKYNPDIFPLYHSYDGGQGTEKDTDKRSNLFRNSSFWIFTILTILAISIGYLSLYRYFHPKPKNPQTTETKKTPANGEKKQTSKTSASQSTVPDFPLNTEWQIVGALTDYVVLQNATHQIRYEPKGMCKGEGYRMICFLDQTKITRYGVTTSQQGLTPRP